MRIHDIKELKSTAGRLLGVDFGDVRTGLAVSDVSRYLASGLETVAPGSMTKTADVVAASAREHGVVGIILGLPVNMNGSEGPRAEHAKLFADMLDERVGDLPVLLLDERMTTMAASRFLNETNTRGQKRKQVIDTLSAQIILQNALDRLKNIP
jgi:putative Holliday junction resolvase